MCARWSSRSTREFVAIVGTSGGREEQAAHLLGARTGHTGDVCSTVRYATGANDCRVRNRKLGLCFSPSSLAGISGWRSDDALLIGGMEQRRAARGRGALSLVGSRGG